MSKIFNPALSKELNLHREEFDIVVRAPFLPPAGEEFSTKVVYHAPDACFYRCIELEGSWTWEKVTFGIHRQYVLSVSFVSPSKVIYNYALVDKEATPAPEDGVAYFIKAGEEYAPAGNITEFDEDVDYYTIESSIDLYVFDDIVNCINDITTGLKRYGITEFAKLEDTTMIDAVEMINALIKHVNYACGTSLVSIPADWEDPDEQVAMEAIVGYLNPLVAAINPHAADKAELEEALKRVAEAEGKLDGSDVAEEVGALRSEVSALASKHTSDMTSLEESLETKATKTEVEEAKTAASEVAAAVEAVRAETSSLASGKVDKEVVEAIATAVTEQAAAIEAGRSAVSALSATVATNTTKAETSLAAANEAKTAATANAEALAKLMAFAEAVADLDAPDDMSVTESAAILRGIVGAAKAVFATVDPE